MLSHTSKIVSALILLNTTICLAMQKSSDYDPYKIEIASATCENRVYSKLQISLAMKGGLRSISLMEETNNDLDVVQYTPKPTEVMPSNEKYYFSELNSLGPNGPTDLVVFSSSGLFAKVVTRVLDSQGFKYTDCVALQTMPLPQELQSSWRFPRQNSGGYDPFGIGITSVSCEDRVYNKLQIAIAIIRGLGSITRMEGSKMNLDAVQYTPKPTEVMPFNDKFYFSELQRLGPNGPMDLVIFSPSGQFAKVVIQKEESGENFHRDCVSSSNRQSPERSPSRMRSPERLQMRMGSPKRRRLRMKPPEQDYFE